MSRIYPLASDFSLFQHFVLVEFLLGFGNENMYLHEKCIGLVSLRRYTLEWRALSIWMTGPIQRWIDPFTFPFGSGMYIAIFMPKCPSLISLDEMQLPFHVGYFCNCTGLAT